MEIYNLPDILNGLATAVFVIDGDRKILLANSAATKLFGERLEGQSFVRAVRHPDCLNIIDDVLQGSQRSQAVIALPVPVRTIFQVNVFGLDMDSQQSARAVISFDDISHVREAEQMRSDFVANVSHELRSPLTALNGFIETLKGVAKDDAAVRERFLDVMEREAHRMDRLIGDLLSLSKLEINERVRPTGVSDVTSIVEGVIATLSLKVESTNKKICLKKTAPVNAVPGDDDELTQVFQNLVENAVKYGEPDLDVIVTIAPVAQTAGLRGRVLSVEVRDIGPGIPAEHIPRLTERFYRVDDSRSRDQGGTGLGLAIVKHIINRHRGRLQIKSETGVGSTFTVLLPMCETAD